MGAVALWFHLFRIFIATLFSRTFIFKLNYDRKTQIHLDFNILKYSKFNKIYEILLFFRLQNYLEILDLQTARSGFTAVRIPDSETGSLLPIMQELMSFLIASVEPLAH